MIRAADPRGRLLDAALTAALLPVAMLDGLTLDAIIADRTTAPELAERGAAAILHTSTVRP
jgi:hypothetical protein